MCQVQLEKQEQYLIVTLQGEVILGCTTEVKEQVKGFAEENQQYNMVIDLTEVNFIDSSGLGALIAWFKMANQQQSRVIFCGMSDYVRKIVSYARLDKIFTIVDTLEEAKTRMQKM